MVTFEEALTIVNQKIKAIKYPENPGRLYEPIAYLLALKGKKIRPALTLLACNLYKDDIEDSTDAALAWEIFHNFTLMHDDVMDNADVRRGKPTVHKKWNENTAILSGDSMLILSYMHLAKSPDKYLRVLLDLFSMTAAEICEGQQYDMEFESRMNVSEREYLDMIRLKTAVMIGAALKTGAIIGGADERDQQLLYDFGINLGIAFQIRDDLLDVYGDPAVFGKKIGGDILCNKKTYLSVSALAHAKGRDRAELVKWFQSDEISPDEKIEAVREIYDKLSLIDKSYQTIKDYYRKSLDAFQAVAVSEKKKQVLMDLAQSLMERES